LKEILIEISEWIVLGVMIVSIISSYVFLRKTEKQRKKIYEYLIRPLKTNFLLFSSPCRIPERELDKWIKYARNYFLGWRIGGLAVLILFLVTVFSPERTLITYAKMLLTAGLIILYLIILPLAGKIYEEVKSAASKAREMEKMIEEWQSNYSVVMGRQLNTFLSEFGL